MTTAELKLMRNLSDSFAIENAIDCEKSILDNGSMKYVPNTSHWSNSNWMAGFKVRHRGQDIWLWYKGFRTDEGAKWYFDRSYNTSIGRPMRKDGALKLRLSFESRALISGYDVSDVISSSCNERFRIVSYHNLEFLIESEKKGGCFVFLKNGESSESRRLLKFYFSKTEAKIGIKYYIQKHHIFLEEMMRLDYKEFNDRQKDLDKVSLSEFCELQIGFKYRGMLVGKNKWGELTFTSPEVQLNIK